MRGYKRFFSAYFCIFFISYIFFASFCWCCLFCFLAIQFSSCSETFFFCPMQLLFFHISISRVYHQFVWICLCVRSTGVVCWRFVLEDRRLRQRKSTIQKKINVVFGYNGVVPVNCVYVQYFENVAFFFSSFSSHHIVGTIFIEIWLPATYYIELYLRYSMHTIMFLLLWLHRMCTDHQNFSIFFSIHSSISSLRNIVWFGFFSIFI